MRRFGGEGENSFRFKKSGLGLLDLLTGRRPFEFLFTPRGKDSS